jgi:hypothetical protein
MITASMIFYTDLIPENDEFKTFIGWTIIVVFVLMLIMNFIVLIFIALQGVYYLWKLKMKHNKISNMAVSNPQDPEMMERHLLNS